MKSYKVKLKFSILLFPLFICSAAHAGVITDAPKISSLLLNVFNFLLSIAGILAILSIVGAGLMYFLASGDAEREKQAKHWFWYALTGSLVIFLGLILVRTLSSFFVD